LRKTPNFFAENWQKSQKIVTILLVQDQSVKKIAQNVAHPFLSKVNIKPLARKK
jgi:hypothetical protein